MPNQPNNEQERLMRLRAKQLADRDPGSKQREFNRMTTTRERKVDRRITSGRVWKSISHAWRGAIIGLVMGTIMLVILSEFWNSPWALKVALGAGVVFILLGVVIGKTLDFRDNLKDLSK